MEFITEVTIGSGTGLAINQWTNNIEVAHEPGNVVATAVGRRTNPGGANDPFLTRQGALNYARSLQSIRWPGEDIFLITNDERESDLDRCTYYVVGPVACDTFAPYIDAKV